MDPIIIIGTGLAGYNLAKEIRKLDKEQPLLLISQDDGRSYSKPMLSTGFTKNKTADDLSMGDAAKMADQLNAEIIIDTIVKSIDTARKVVVTDKAEYAYKDLVLGVGADVISPPLEGDGTDDVFSINDLQDYAKFRQSLETGEKKSVLIIGAGLIGCEFANDLANGGYNSQVVDPVGRCLPALLPESASAAVQRGLEGLGVKFHWGPLVKAVNKTDAGLTALLSDGATIDADIVISAIGLRPRIDLAKAAGISVNRGVVVNRQLQTSDSHVYALGDCKEIEENVTLYVLPLMAEARTLAKTLTGDATDIKYAPMPVMVKTPCCPIVVSPVPAGVNGKWTDEVNEGNNVKSLFHDSDGQLRGFALTGDLIKEKAALAKEVPTLLS